VFFGFFSFPFGFGDCVLFFFLFAEFFRTVLEECWCFVGVVCLFFFCLFWRGFLVFFFALVEFCSRYRGVFFNLLREMVSSLLFFFFAAPSEQTCWSRRSVFAIMAVPANARFSCSASWDTRAIPNGPGIFFLPRSGPLLGSSQLWVTS